MSTSENTVGHIEDAVIPTSKYRGVFDNFKLQYSLHADIDTKDGRGYTGVFCDYESGEWNYRQFIAWIAEHLPSFALTPEEFTDLNDRNMLEKLERAAGIIYGRKNIVDRRGEFGELILHGLIRDIYQTTPLISKIFYKTGVGETVKGADCVHVIEKDGEIDSLWLGEAKFYKDGNAGLTEAVKSVEDMLNRLANREEFLTIRHHLKDSTASISKKAEELLSDATSLDKIKAKICVPMLVTYDSDVTNAHIADTSVFRQELNTELQPFIEKYLSKTTGIKEVDVHIFFMPLKSKKRLVEILDTFIDRKRSIEL